MSSLLPAKLPEQMGMLLAKFDHMSITLDEILKTLSTVPKESPKLPVDFDLPHVTSARTQMTHLLLGNDVAATVTISIGDGGIWINALPLAAGVPVIIKLDPQMAKTIERGLLITATFSAGVAHYAHGWALTS